MRRTKIVCTLGPATDSYSVLKRMIKAGMNVARLNMSHGTHEDAKKRIDMVKQAREELLVPVAIMLDSKGPEIRIKKFEGGRVELVEGDTFTLTTEDIMGDSSRVSITYPKLPSKVKVGDPILINDGFIEVKVEKTTQKEVICTVVYGGELTDNKSINLPNTHIDMPYMSEADRRDFLFGIQQEIDYIALSFVRNADDVKIIRHLMFENNATNIQLIAKIENREGVKNLEEILDFCDGAMVARGDMGVEIPFEELPGIQKEMIKTCYQRGKKVITATQMLESMISSPRPTRAETSDVANAIYDGTSATMLSGETAIGKYCVDAVKTMAKIAVKTESEINFRKRFESYTPEIRTITDAVSHSTVSASYDLNAKAIIVVSKSGYTARKVSRFRPICPIIGVTTSKKGYYQLAMNWGVMPVMAKEKKNSDELFVHAADRAKETGIVKAGDLVVIAAGVPVGISGNTNTLRIEYIK
ncbi:MAG: pyruvate kinase [Firmicutes bacterium]|nr:pyruvate kinase [Bacillota bacterium]